MPVTAPKTIDVLASVRAALSSDATAAAGGNALISKSEEAALAAGVLKEGVGTVRQNNGPGKTVRAEDAAAEAARLIETLLTNINQSGPTKVSQAEVRALANVNADAGQRVAKAYELLTGKAIALDPVVTPPVPPPTPGAALPVGSVAIMMSSTTAIPHTARLLPNNVVEVFGVTTAGLGLEVLVPGFAQPAHLGGGAGGALRAFVQQNTFPSATLGLLKDAAGRWPAFGVEIRLRWLSDDSRAARFDVCPQGTAPKGIGLPLGVTGPATVNQWWIDGISVGTDDAAVAPGDTVQVTMADGQTFSATADASTPGTRELLEKLRDVVRVAGYDAVVKPDPNRTGGLLFKFIAP